MPNPGTGYLPDVEIYDGHPTFDVGMTPFGFYDNDKNFATDAVKVARFVATRLGWPLMDVELQSGSMFAAFEEAVTTYGNQVYAWKVRENYLSLEGGSADYVANDMVLEPSLQRIVEIAKNYGTEAEVGGNITLHTGLLDVKPGIQDYDLNKWAEEQGIEGGIEIRKIFYEAPPAILRYFDPYAGTGTGIQSLMDAFDFGSYSPGVNFLLMPVSADILKIQAIEFNDQVRKSAYTFRITNNQLTLFPIPALGGKLRLEYYKMSDKRKLNPSVKHYKSMSVSRVDFNAQAGVPFRLQLFDGQNKVDLTKAVIQFYQSCESKETMLIPESVITSTTETKAVDVTFLEDTEGFALISYLSLEKGTEATAFSQEIQVPSSGSIVINHGLNSSNVMVQVYSVEDETVELIIPSEVTILDKLNVEVTFSKAFNGVITVTAIPELQTGSRDRYSYTSNIECILEPGQTEKLVTIKHMLHSKDLGIQVFAETGEDEYEVVIPTRVVFPDDNTVVLAFTKDITGYVTATAAKVVEDSGDYLETNIITNVSEVPYENPTYSKINSIGKQWIFRYTLAIAREMLAYIRGKYQTIPIPNSEATLNHGDLLTDARDEKAKLLEELDKMLDSTSRQAQLERKSQEAEFLQKTLQGVPMCIYIG